MPVAAEHAWRQVSGSCSARRNASTGCTGRQLLGERAGSRISAVGRRPARIGAGDRRGSAARNRGTGHRAKPQAGSDYLGGREAAAGALMGKAMALAGGKAHPANQALLQAALEAGRQ